jgi:methylthioribose-1-phosphate isomerase
MEDLITTQHRFRLRTVAIAVAGLIAGAAVLTPAVSGAAAFLTKQKARKLFLENTTVSSAPTTVQPSEGAAIQVLCPAGQQATNGGADSPIDSTSSGTLGDNMILDESKPIQSGARSIGWYVEVANLTSNPITASAYAVCSK